jgi:hypothetical protein
MYPLHEQDTEVEGDKNKFWGLPCLQIAQSRAILSLKVYKKLPTKSDNESRCPLVCGNFSELCLRKALYCLKHLCTKK